ncbi:VOC family protein [Streptomyces sp. NPDC002788]
MSSIRQFQVTFDCAEPERVARFWREVLGYVAPPPPEFALGAVRVRLLPADDDNASCIVMQDIEGNEFCLD